MANDELLANKPNKGNENTDINANTQSATHLVHKKNLEFAPDQKKVGIDISDPFAPMRNVIEKISPKNKTTRWIGIILFAVLVAFTFTKILNGEFSAMQKAISSALLFILSGEIARAWMGWEGTWGLILFKDRSTLSWIDRQAKRYEKIWVALADVGLVLGYGLFSYFLFAPERKKLTSLIPIYIFGILLLLLFSSVVAPMAFPVVAGMISGGDVHSASNYLRESVSDIGGFKANVAGKDYNFSYFGIFATLVLIIFGLAGSVVLSLVYYSLIILPALLGKIGAGIIALITGGKFNSDGLPPPGGAPIIPGINLPLVEGIIALASLLVVHEMSHGLLARIYNVRLDSAGIVFWGILPFGAFVEPDEKDMNNIKTHEINRILVAGSASNLIMAMITFALLTGVIAMTQDIRLEGYFVESGPLPQGAAIYSIGGEKYYGQNVSLSANTNVQIQTSAGTFDRVTDSNGKIGISMSYYDKSGLGFRYKFIPGFEWMGFVLNTLGLIFATSVLVGIVNLLPIPLFDGNKLMENGVGNKKIAMAIAVIACGAFIVNILPWIFR
ncbi:MAG: site-2 protease family protein [Candidatus Micrarchaeia archaeon]